MHIILCVYRRPQTELVLRVIKYRLPHAAVAATVIYENATRTPRFRSNGSEE